MPAPLRVPVVRGIARGVLSGVMGEGGHAWQWQWIHGGAAASEEDALRRLAPLASQTDQVWTFRAERVQAGDTGCGVDFKCVRGVE